MKYCGILFFIALALVSCTDNRDVFYSKDKKTSFTIITKGDIRYIINGYHNKIPKDNYVKISLKKLDRYVQDEIIGCWKKNGLDWIILMKGVTVLEDKLDKDKFLFRSNFSMDSTGTPTSLDHNTKI